MNIPRSNVFILFPPHRRVLLSPYSYRFYKHLCCLTPITHMRVSKRDFTSSSKKNSNRNRFKPWRPLLHFDEATIYSADEKKKKRRRRKAVRWLRSLEYEAQTQQGLPTSSVNKRLYIAQWVDRFTTQTVWTRCRRSFWLCVCVCVCARARSRVCVCVHFGYAVGRIIRFYV